MLMNSIVSEPTTHNDPWSPMPSSGGQASSQRNDAWSPIIGGQPTSSTAEAASIDPFSPIAQKELSDFDLLRNEIENCPMSNNGGMTFMYLILNYLVIFFFSNWVKIFNEGNVM